MRFTKVAFMFKNKIILEWIIVLQIRNGWQYDEKNCKKKGSWRSQKKYFNICYWGLSFPFCSCIVFNCKKMFNAKALKDLLSCQIKWFNIFLVRSFSYCLYILHEKWIIFSLLRGKYWTIYLKIGPHTHTTLSCFN